MAEQSVQHVVNQAQSVGEQSSIDVSGNLQSSNAMSGGEVEAGERSEITKQSDAQSKISPEVEVARYSENNTTPEGQDNVEDSNTAPKSEEQRTYVAESRENLVNGDSGSYDESDDPGDQNSASGDTIDPSRGEGVEPSQDASTGQERSSSIKKPVSFKPVSVTKAFLAKSGTAASAAAKAPADKVAPLSQTVAALAPQGPKPRLVAKSGRDARMTSLRVGPGTSGGPDASKVWNRNKPVPAPTPKQFTDEELKQQYGIHLATRLQTDEAGKESKWADIDDDVDDWAPETVEWMDGTKSTITSAETQAALLAASGAQASKDSEEAAKEAAAAAQRLSSVSSLGKTILRPGARAISQTKPGLVLRSVPENPLASDKPATPAAAKSPWAPLPPIDKISPISFLPPAAPSPQPTTALPRDLPPPEAGAQPPSEAREIAADDFNRSWRDGERSSGRELFNSQSGRYEPVKAPPPRRPSRQESSGFRAPSLMQRPSQHGQVGQAEPSPTFQSQRGSSEQDGRSWTRNRRDSSSMGERSTGASERVSEQGSGEIPGEARASPALHHPNEIHPSHSPATSQFDNVTSPNPSVAELVPSVGGPQSYHARGADRSQLPPADGPSPQDVRAVQQQLMREKIELNRTRKKEEEAREEAARLERIRLRMEALGPPPSLAKDATTEEKLTSKDSDVHQAPLISKEKSKGESSQQYNPSSAAEKMAPTSQATATAAASDKASSAPATASPNEVRPRKVNKLSPATKTSPPVSEPSVSNRPELAPANSPPFVGSRPSKSLSDTNVSNTPHDEVQQLPGLGQAPPLERAAQPWSGMSQGADPLSWTASSRAINSSNVWGPPSNDKPLGNGAFEIEFQRIPALHRQHQASLPHHTHGSLSPRPSSMSPSMPFDNGPVNPNQAYSKSRADNVPHTQNTLSPPTSTNSFPQPRHQLPNTTTVEHPRSSDQAVKRGWKDFHALATKQEAEAREKRRLEVPTEVELTFVETFRETKSGDKAGDRQLNNIKTVVNTTSDMKVDGEDTQAAMQNPTLGQHTPQQATIPPATSNGRASRFFGPGVDRGNVVVPTPLPVIENGVTEPASPPPPDSEDHPVYGRTSHPLVHLPSPAPRVKLPPMLSPLPTPSRSLTSPDPVTMPTRLRVGSQPLVAQADWQDRFNGLFGRATLKPSARVPSKTPPPETAQPAVQQVFAVEISSKAAFDVASVPITTAVSSTTVSLPQGLETIRETPAQMLRASLPDDHTESKPTEDELMDEREFGSSPTVNLSRASYDIEILRMMPSPRFVSKSAQAEMDGDFVASMPALSFDDLDFAQKVDNGLRISIRILGREFESKIMREKTSLNAGSRTTKMSRNNKKRNVTGKSGMGGSVNSQSPQSMTPGSETTFTEKFSPQPEQDRRSGWAKPPKSSKGPGPRSTSDSVTNAQTTPTIPSSTDRIQASAADKSTSAQRQPSRGGWAKPPRGKTSQGFNPNRI